MKLAEKSRLAERSHPSQFHEMAVWHEWPLDDGDWNVPNRVNVGTAERWLSALGGSALAAYGIRRKDMTGYALAALGGGLVLRGATGRCNAYRVLGVNTAQHGAAAPVDYFERGIHVTQSITINRPPAELYAFWRTLSNLPHVMSHIKHVIVLDDLRSRWVARGPLNSSVEWDAEIINDEPPDTIAWRSLENADVHNAGSVRFLPGPHGRGTFVKVNIEYIPTAGRLGHFVAKMFNSAPDQEIKEDLRRFKSLMEAGEVLSTDHQPRGRCN